jgi:hypothetical protein
MFDIPIVLFTFKRKDTVFRIIERLAEIKPKKVYIISDGPRNEEEKDIILDVRKSIESYINWDCEIVKNYAQVNKGVYNRIGEGANWVFEKEQTAIFLEDDNLPEVTFFSFCKEMLEKYENDTRILWVVGTNYMRVYVPEDGSSYMFTKHMLPCGWASWSNKFKKFYDGKLELLDNEKAPKRLRYEFINKKLYKQELLKYFKTKHLLNNNINKVSWDSQIGFSLRINGLYGISPKYNQIENIGVDIHSIHGGTSFSKTVMTQRFCGIKTIPLEFPLNHPKYVLSDIVYEKKTAKIVLYPYIDRLKISIMTFLKPLLGIDKYSSFKIILKEKRFLS